MKPAAHRDIKPDNVIDRVDLGEGVVMVVIEPADPQVDEAIDRWLLSLLDERTDSGTRSGR